MKRQYVPVEEPLSPFIAPDQHNNGSCQGNGGNMYHSPIRSTSLEGMQGHEQRRSARPFQCAIFARPILCSGQKGQTGRDGGPTRKCNRWTCGGFPGLQSISSGWHTSSQRGAALLLRLQRNTVWNTHAIKDDKPVGIPAQFLLDFSRGKGGGWGWTRGGEGHRGGGGGGGGWLMSIQQQHISHQSTILHCKSPS